MTCREQEFCYKDGSMAFYHKPCKMRAGFHPKFDVLLTSYEYPNVDASLLGSIQWSSLVIDEAHRLKNNTSLVGAGIVSVNEGNYVNV